MTIRLGFVPPGPWTITGPLDCLTLFEDSDEAGVLYKGVALCGGNCLSRLVMTGTETPLELIFRYRWLSSVGVLDFTLGDQLLHRLEAPGAVQTTFQEVRVPLLDPALRSSGFQQFMLCLTPESARIELANVWLRSAPELGAPVLSARRGSGANLLDLSWDSQNGRTYRLQSRASLVTGSWSDVGPAIPGTGSPLSRSIEVQSGDSTTFYRVQVDAGP
jgi:hypothetical protein